MPQSKSQRKELKNEDFDNREKLDALNERDIAALAAFFMLLDLWERTNAEDV